MKTDDAIRRQLARTPSTSPAFDPRLDEVIGIARTRRRRKRVTAGVLGFVILAGMVAPLGLLYGLGGQQKNTVAPRPVHPVFAAQIRVHGAVDVAATGSAAWVTGFGVVSRVDPTTDRVVAKIPTPGVEDFSSVAIGEGGVWVTADGGLVYRIDPRTDRVVATIRTGGNAGGIAVGGGLVWTTKVRSGPGVVIRIDPVTHRVTGRPITVGPGPLQVVYGYGAVWVENTSPASVMRVDAHTLRVTTVPITGSLAVGYGSVWAASGDVLQRLDPRTDRVEATVRIPGAAGVAVGGGEAWVLALQRSVHAVRRIPSLWGVDPRTNRPVGTPTRLDVRQPIALAASGRSVWIADYGRETVTRFDLVRATPTAASGSPIPPPGTGTPLPSPTGPSSSPGQQTVIVDGVPFTVSGTDSQDGPCIGVSAPGGSIGGGCGRSQGPFRVGEGSVRVNGRLYDVVYGETPSGATRVEVVISPTQTLSANASSGVWLVVIAAADEAGAADHVSVRAEDDAGNLIAEVKVPSLAAVRNAAKKAALSMAIEKSPVLAK